MNNNYPGYIPNHAMQEDYQNYVQNYLFNNIGKQVEVHASFCDSIEWRDSIFKGILLDVGKDYLVVKNEKQYLIWSIYIDYVILS